MLYVLFGGFLVRRGNKLDRSRDAMSAPPRSSRRSRSEVEFEAGGCSVIMYPSTSGDQRLLIRAGSQETVCTLSHYGERVATGEIVPYLAVRIRPEHLAALNRLQAGTYDVTIETGYHWSEATQEFQYPTGKRRSQRPLRLFGRAGYTLWAYPVAGGDFPLGDV
ncbi:hypothetical protein ACIA5G_50530 [Amycolatopsis sp. NPDC051758]|uniref:hypothetical protein n=1 Tax=Amycolatopsis sp. NPDC051758 TaxID=3363935 RepID=UPI003794ED56